MTDRQTTLTETLDVVVAEDDAHDQMLMVMAAQDAGSDIEFGFVSDGEQLLDLLRHRAAAGTQPDLVVLDMRMPKLDGHEVLDALRQEPAIGPRIVGVFSSSYRQQDIEKSIEKGAAWHEVKPSKFEDLVEFVNRIADQCR